MKIELVTKDDLFAVRFKRHFFSRWRYVSHGFLENLFTYSEYPIFILSISEASQLMDLFVTHQKEKMKHKERVMRTVRL